MRYGRLLVALGVVGLTAFLVTVGIAKDRSHFRITGHLMGAPGWCKKHPERCPPPTTTTPPPTTTTPPPPPGDLRPIDGGPNYYGQFTHSLGDEPSYFPLGPWNLYDFTQAHIDQDKAVGWNTYIGNGGSPPNPAEPAVLDANGMRVLNSPNEPNVANATSHRGYLLDDEVDGRFGVPQGFTVMQQDNANTPNDGRIRYANYTKPILTWMSDADAGRFVNEFQQLVSSDWYWFTDPWSVPTMTAPSWMPEHGQTISTPQIRRAANYGYQIDEMRRLDALDGQRKPIWAVVEDGWPFDANNPSAGQRTIAPAEMRAAVWHSIIAGARGIIYFNHSFGGPCQTQYVNRDTSGCYTAIQQELTRTDGQIAQLAPVLNSPFEDSFATVSPSVRLMTKNYNGQRYIFAGSRGTSSAATFSVQSGSTATVMFENRSISISGGQFSDDFVDGNAIHIYRVDQ